MSIVQYQSQHGLTGIRAMEASELPSNVIEVPISRIENQSKLNNKDELATARAPNMESANAGPKKSRWWPL